MTEIQKFVDGVVDGRLSDSDVEAWMRNVFDNGLSESETVGNSRMRCSILEPYLSGPKSGNIWW